jgi:hypothetical protein
MAPVTSTGRKAPKPPTGSHTRRPANLTTGRLFRRINKNGKAWGDVLTEKAVWHVVRGYARKAGTERLAPNDLRRTCARL